VGLYYEGEPVMNGIVICSGGMDSVVLAYKMARQHQDELTLVSFDYGQRHKKELVFAYQAADYLGANWIKVPMDFMANLLGGSALTDPDIDVPLGHYADESMKQTVVPNRNMIMLSIAAGIAVANNASYVATAVHAGDHPVYPDCRPEFIDSCNMTVKFATAGFGNPSLQVIAPFVNKSKDQICRIGWEIDVPFEDTWSCYQGGEIHCGRCGTCVERKEAFELAGVEDPTVYER
jgi:7-cyano-7-deazaguanine synthase